MSKGKYSYTYLGRHYFLGVPDSCSKNCILCVQATYRPIRRTVPHETCWHGEDAHGTCIGSASRTRMLYERNASQSTRTACWALLETLRTEQFALFDNRFCALVYESLKTEFGRVELKDNTKKKLSRPDWKQKKTEIVRKGRPSSRKFRKNENKKCTFKAMRTFTWIFCFLPVVHVLGRSWRTTLLKFASPSLRNQSAKVRSR